MSYVMRKLNNNQVEELKLLRQAGWSVIRIARHFNISPAAVNYRLNGTKPWTAKQLIHKLKEAA